MLITICRLYDSYADASLIVLALEAAGVPPSEASLISNNSDAWFKAAETENVIPLRKKSVSSEAASKVEGAAIGAAIGATTATAASLVTMLALPGVGAVVGAGWLAAMLGSMAIGGVTGGLLGALTNAGISEEDAHVLVEGVRRGGTLVVARVSQSEAPKIEEIMNQSGVNLSWIKADGGLPPRIPVAVDGPSFASHWSWDRSISSPSALAPTRRLIASARLG